MYKPDIYTIAVTDGSIIIRDENNNRLFIDTDIYRFSLITPNSSVSFSYKHKLRGPVKNFLLIAWVAEYIRSSYRESVHPEAVEFIDNLYRSTNTVQDNQSTDFIGEVK